jgi:hypothetical protein
MKKEETLSYPHVTQFETLDRRARLAVKLSARRSRTVRPVRFWNRLRRRRLTVASC